MLSRHEMIKMGLLSVLVLWCSTIGISVFGQARQGPACQPFFCNELAIPPLAQPLDRVKDAATIKSILDQAVAEASQPGRFPISQKLLELLKNHADFYEIRMDRASKQILPGEPTKIWGYNGMFPGPTIVSERAKPLVVRFANNLSTLTETVETTVHHHGGHTPPSSDGYPSDKFASGSRVFLYPDTFTRGCPNWYHDHAEDVTGRNVYMGLAGLMLFGPATPAGGMVPDMLSAFDDDELQLEQARIPGCNLPTVNTLTSGCIERDPTTGKPTGLTKFDIPLVLQDRVFGVKDGLANQLIYNPFDFDGVLGDTFLVNGTNQPFREVERRKYHLRMLNGSNARVYQLGFSEDPKRLTHPLEIVQIGTDTGLMPKATARTNLLLAMAERLELIFDFSQVAVGRDVFLVNCLQQTEGRRPDDFTPKACTPLLRFRVKARGPEADPPVATKDGDDFFPFRRTDAGRHIEEITSPEEAVATREFKFERSHGEWAINGELFQAHVITRDGEDRETRPRLGTVEIWTFTNSSGGWVHPIHKHADSFVILDRNGHPPEPEEAGFKDTVFLDRGDTARVIFRVGRQWGPWSRAEGGEDDIGDYVFHCHNIEHEDMAMMGTFSIVGP